jgi:uncharacterized protein with NRDE domain
MCVVAIALKAHPDYPLIVAANRDERFGRPARPADFWPEDGEVLGGRDLAAGGAWLAISRRGRFAVVTNGGGAVPPGERSRGELVGEFVTGDEEPGAYLALGAEERSRYAPFYLVAGEVGDLHHLDGASGAIQRLTPGIHVVLNHGLDEPSRKGDRVRQDMRGILDQGPAPDPLLEMLADETRYPEEAVPIPGAPREISEAVTAVRVRAGEYGTRCSTVVLVDADGEVTFFERPFDASGTAGPDRTFRFDLHRR